MASLSILAVQSGNLFFTHFSIFFKRTTGSEFNWYRAFSIVECYPTTTKKYDQLRYFVKVCYF
jgi:hypothetical protein